MKISKISNQLPSETRPIKRPWKPQSGRRSNRAAMVLPSAFGLRGKCDFGFPILDFGFTKRLSVAAALGARSPEPGSAEKCGGHRPSLHARRDAPMTISLLKPPASGCQPAPASPASGRDVAVAAVGLPHPLRQWRHQADAILRAV